MRKLPWRSEYKEEAGGKVSVGGPEIPLRMRRVKVSKLLLNTVLTIVPEQKRSLIVVIHVILIPKLYHWC